MPDTDSASNATRTPITAITKVTVWDVNINDQRRFVAIDAWFFDLVAALLDVTEPSPAIFSADAPSITSAWGLAVVGLTELFVLLGDFFRSAM